MVSTGALALTPLGCSRRRLYIYNWGSYLAPSIAKRFETQHSIDLQQDVYLSEAELVAKLRANAAYDLAVPIDYLMSSMQRDGLLAPLPENLPGYQHLDTAFQPWRAKPERGGQLYGVPYLWGTTGIGYNSDLVDEPSSWNALFDERYAGHISVLDSKGDVMDQALLAAGMDINSTDKPRIRAEVWPRLKAQKQLLRAYDSNPSTALLSGETWIAQIDSGDLLAARAKKPSLRYIIPNEGAARWTDYLAIPKAAVSPKLALAFIEYLLQPDIAAENANALHFATPNASALEQALLHDAHDPHVYPPPEVRERLFESENWAGKTGSLVDEIWLDVRSG